MAVNTRYKQGCLGGRGPSPEIWAEAVIEIVSFSSDPTARAVLSERAKGRASGTLVWYGCDD